MIARVVWVSTKLALEIIALVLFCAGVLVWL